jgi:TRAP-type C4-dicarboxylate transport system substrate-binding protein
MGWEAKTFERLGASTVFMGPSEATTAMKTGVIDGGAQVYYGMAGWGLMDITKEVYETRGHYISFGLWGANMRKWKSWPEDVRQIIVQASKEVESQWIACQDKFDRKAKEKFKSKNVPIYILTDEELKQAKKLTRPVLDEWLQEVGDVGEKIFKEYKDLLKQHSRK